MERLIDRYEKKLIEQGLVEKGQPLMAELETELVWNREDPRCDVLADVFKNMSINAVCFSQPAEPYRTMVDYLSSKLDTIMLKDNETRLFLHDLPVIREFSAEKIITQLKRRKSAIIEGHGIITYGTVSPEQTFVVYSSVLFSCFVKFLADFLEHAKNAAVSTEEMAAFKKVIKKLPPFPRINIPLQKAPFTSEDEVYKAVCEVGKPVVNYGFVDSVMGNISYLYNATLHISQTGSFLDELEGSIDPCPMDNSSCTGITASSELPAHMLIVANSPNRAVLHGHPKFSVIMSLICDKKECEFEGQCHVKCPDSRFVGDIPIVPGETGTGPNALCNTVPKALKDHRGAIVYGHGVFTVGQNDFNQPFNNLIEIEKMCRDEYFNRLRTMGILDIEE
jgi:ribulose-5-phosphate 4-epimerase/fuculose-1-phosphate aldolase